MVVVVDDGHLHRHPVEVHHPVDHQWCQRRCHPWRQGEGCHCSHAGNTLVSSRSWGVNTGDTLWMETSLKTNLGSLVSPPSHGMSMLGTPHGWRCHHRHPGDTLDPSQLCSTNVVNTPGLGTSLGTTLGSLCPFKVMGCQPWGHSRDGNVPNSQSGVSCVPSRSWGINAGDTPGLVTSLITTLRSPCPLKVMGCHHGGHPGNVVVPKSHLEVPTSPPTHDASTCTTPYRWGQAQEPL